ncbi:hypothetical protein ACIQU5_27560 [Streptomyces sp. NPDC090306]|uniref:hypothetical protein n=1 Tax=unclassified Streptomyces TaxID=2593676 RepID=UPI0036E1790B
MALSLAALVLLPPYGGRASADDGEQDVRLVYCLGDGHRAGLAEAAVRLGLVVRGAAADTVVPPGGGGSPVSLESWERRRPDDFARACDALMTAEGDSPGKSSGGGWGGTVLAFVQSVCLLAVGAAISLTSQSTSERRHRERQLTTDLREFRRIACLYLTAYEADPTTAHDEVRRARETLGGTLALVPGRGARRRSAQLLAETLPLADRLPRSRDGADLGPQERRAESARVRAVLDRQTREIGALTRPAPARLLDGLPRRGRGRSGDGTAPGGHQE